MSRKNPLQIDGLPYRSFKAYGKSVKGDSFSFTLTKKYLLDIKNVSAKLKPLRNGSNRPDLREQKKRSYKINP